MSNRLIILDLDNTMVDTLHVWGTSLARLLKSLSEELNISQETLHDLVRRTHGQYRFNDGVSLIDWMFEQEPDSFPTPKQRVVRSIQDEWLEQSAALSVPYDGTIEMLRQWNEEDCKIVIQTDAESCAVLRRLWWMAQHTVTDGELEKPEDILDLVEKIYCQPSLPHSPRYLSDVGFEFRKRTEEKFHIWQDKIFKPSSSHLAKILADHGATPRKTVYIGDGHKDGAEAKSLSVAFAWAQYGAKVSQEILDLYALVGSRNYSYGEETVRAAFAERGVVPQWSLDTGLPDLKDASGMSNPLRYERGGLRYTRPLV